MILFLFSPVSFATSAVKIAHKLEQENMSRVEIDLPENFQFETEIAVRITDLNYGGHVGNDTFLSIIHEARVQFLKSLGYSELNVEGVGIIMADTALVYSAEVFYGTVLKVKVGVQDFTRTGCDIIYLLEDAKSGKEVGKAKTGILFFNYDRRKVVRTPEEFRKLF